MVSGWLPSTATIIQVRSDCTEQLQYEKFSFSHGLRVLMQRLKVEYNVTVTIDATLPQFDDHNSDISDYQRLIDDWFEN